MHYDRRFIMGLAWGRTTPWPWRACMRRAWAAAREIDAKVQAKTHKRRITITEAGVTPIDAIFAEPPSAYSPGSTTKLTLPQCRL